MLTPLYLYSILSLLFEFKLYIRLNENCLDLFIIFFSIFFVSAWHLYFGILYSVIFLNTVIYSNFCSVFIKCLLQDTSKKSDLLPWNKKMSPWDLWNRRLKNTPGHVPGNVSGMFSACSGQCSGPTTDAMNTVVRRSQSKRTQRIRVVLLGMTV